MKIAFVLTQSLDSPSGLGRYSPLARELVRLGHKVTVVALHYAWDELHQRRTVQAGVKVIYAGQMHVRKSGPRKSYPSTLGLLGIGFQATWRLAQTLRNVDADVIHVGKPQPFNVLAARLGRAGRPLYYDCDDYEAATNRFGGAWQRRIVRHFEDSIIRDATALTVNTHFTAERYVALGYPRERIWYVPNGVDRERFATPPNTADLRNRWNLSADTPVVLYVGTLGLQSHPVDLLLRAFAGVQQVLPAARLLMVGGGEDYDEVRRLAGALGIDDKTHFAGRVEPEEVPAYLALATVSVDPVHDDLIARARSPLKVLESIAMGVPVITSDVGDRSELLMNGKLGVLVTPGDAGALANGLIELLSNPEQHDAMADAAHGYREEWYWDNLVHRFVGVYSRH